MAKASSGGTSTKKNGSAKSRRELYRTAKSRGARKLTLRGRGRSYSNDLPF